MLWMKPPRTISLRDACSPSSRPLKQQHRGEMCFWLAAFFSPPLLTPQDLLRAAPTTIQPHTHQLNLLPVYQSINYLCIDGGWVKANHTACYVEPGHFLNVMIWIKEGLNTRKRESHLSQNGMRNLKAIYIGEQILLWQCHCGFITVTGQWMLWYFRHVTDTKKVCNLVILLDTSIIHLCRRYTDELWNHNILLFIKIILDFQGNLTRRLSE